ncbi:hypothetical protein [Arundinibacter roseus]|uniref:Uncharacterized protein n=1 Tax=Arundinibacter roseus TaxID=2070510 RepID=A0A4R4K859_9BACT|nr:hypothetical protein [Arundinibacter roseus]TDB63760.1 hypothetical protein EZE20_15830 [Arundinibacter roseus]
MRIDLRAGATNREATEIIVAKAIKVAARMGPGKISSFLAIFPGMGLNFFKIALLANSLRSSIFTG